MIDHDGVEETSSDDIAAAMAALFFGDDDAAPASGATSHGVVANAEATEPAEAPVDPAQPVEEVVLDLREEPAKVLASRPEAEPIAAPAPVPSLFGPRSEPKAPAKTASTGSLFGPRERNAPVAAAPKLQFEQQAQKAGPVAFVPAQEVEDPKWPLLAGLVVLCLLAGGVAWGATALWPDSTSEVVTGQTTTVSLIPATVQTPPSTTATTTATTQATTTTTAATSTTEVSTTTVPATVATTAATRSTAAPKKPAATAAPSTTVAPEEPVTVPTLDIPVATEAPVWKVDPPADSGDTATE